ncbi:hypothetical protein [Parvularcula bermudensis]|nr:hypothetical protein [Parvularcula bermudensis]
MGSRWIIAAVAVLMGSTAGAEDAPSLSKTQIGAAPLLETTASFYVRLREDLSFVDATPLNSASITRQAHERLASHPVDRMARAQLAYAALIAAESPRFAASLAEKGQRDKRREAFLEDLRENPGVVRDLRGADEAIEAIRTAFAKDAMRIEALGDRYIADAYRLQETGWARSKLPTKGMTRVNAAKSYKESRDWVTYAPRAQSSDMKGARIPLLKTDQAWSPDWSSEVPPAAPPLDQDRQFYMTKALVLAARYALDDLNTQHLEAYKPNRRGKRCYTMAMLNFDQCIAATRTSYEEAFCIGTHGLQDVSRCVGWIAEAGSPRG